jgi:hypothetical protein
LSVSDFDVNLQPPNSLAVALRSALRRSDRKNERFRGVHREERNTWYGMLGYAGTQCLKLGNIAND